jgi:4-amino-4-deoxy-L-arabinose transferase-like glycosyltransferase
MPCTAQSQPLSTLWYNDLQERIRSHDKDDRMHKPAAPSAARQLRITLFLSATLVLALGLRLWFVHRVEPFVDEYISMLAIRSIVRYGVPRLPSGLLYAPKGLLHSYIGALSYLTLGQTAFALRLPSVMAGMLTVCCLYRAGRDWFSPFVGVLAAIALVCSPSVVEWNGRVRMYAQLQLFSLIGVYMLVNGYSRTNSHRTRILGILTMVLAIFSHTLALIILGSVVIGLATSWWTWPKTRQRFLMPSTGEIVAWCLLMIAVAILHPAKGAWGFQGRLSDLATGTLSAKSIENRLLHLIAFTYSFVTRPLWPLTLLYVVGLINLILRWIRGAPVSGDRVAWLLYVVGFCAWLTTSSMTKLHDDRYLFAITPFYFLLVFREAQLLLETVMTSIKPARIRPIAPLLVISIIVVALLVPATIGSMNEKDTGLLPAFAYVRENWHCGDVVAAEATAASLLLLDRADYYVRQHGAESIDGVSTVTGAPLISSPAQFMMLLHNHPRVWFVVEELAWKRYFGSEFRQIILDTMDLAFYDKHTFVFVN